jgi:two-component system chemotaxis response regulator CheB
VIKLLIADDSALMRKLLEGIFRAEGDFDIKLARDGNEALALVRSFDPDVVTLDVQMPGIDGLTCLGQIMIEKPRPVVMISSLTADGAEATLTAIELGAVDFISKPSGTVSLEIDTLRPLLVAKVRAAAKARIRPTLRLAERVRHQIRGARLQSRRRGRCCVRAAADRQLDRRAGRARYRAAAAAGAISLAGASGAAYAVNLHRALRQAARSDLRATRRRSRPTDAAGAGDDLYRSRRCRCDRGAAALRDDHDVGAGTARLSLASERGANGVKRDGAF